MVSFQCDGCADTVKKPKLDQHRQRCWASFTCLDCSKTFQNQEYKSHTSCISEAEKYQGALYKGPRVNDAPAPAIHPSRMNLVENGAVPRYQPGPAPVKARGPKMSGENKRAPEGGMRSWGSPAVTEEVQTVVPEKKKRKKGDKGGTGSKANSKQKEEAVELSTKRKRSESPVGQTPVGQTPVEQTPVDKTLKRLRKNAAKIALPNASLSLEEWLGQVGKKVDGDVNKATKVVFEDGKWVLSF